jgi:hypothetical protein
MKYSEKLRDPRWQRKRLEVMQRDKFTCLACGDKASTLNVHHKQYHGDPWDAPMPSLETLCEACHGRRGELNKRILSLPSKIAFSIELPVECDFDTTYELDRLIEIEEMWLSKNLRNGDNDAQRTIHCELLMDLQSKREIKLMCDGGWNEELKCNVIKIEYKYATVSIYLPPGDVPDGLGAQRIAERLIPGCERIKFYNGGVLSHGFHRHLFDSPWNDAYGTCK